MTTIETERLVLRPFRDDDDRETRESRSSAEHECRNEERMPDPGTLTIIGTRVLSSHGEFLNR